MIVRLHEVRSLVRSTLLLQEGRSSDVVLEGRLEDARAKFPSVDVDELSREDPSGSQLKYLMWMVRQRSLGAKTEDLLSTVRFFHRNIVKFEKKDINSYATLRELEDAAKEAFEKGPTGRERRTLSKEGSETVWENQDLILKFVGNRESCQLYGKGTKWCITMRDEADFEEYAWVNIVFYFLLRRSPKGDPFDKVALTVWRDRENKLLPREPKFRDARNNKVSRKTLAKRVSGSAAAVSAALADAVRRPKWLIAKIKDGEATEKDEREALRIYGKNPKIVKVFARELRSAEVLRKLSGDENVSVRLSVGCNPSTSAEVLMKLAGDSDAGVRRYVAGNTSTSAEVLGELSRDSDVELRQNVAQNPSTSVEVLKVLSGDDVMGVRGYVARNPSAPVEVIRKLSGSAVVGVRGNVARNPSAPVEVLRKLLGDKNELVRRGVVENPSTPVEVLRKLSRDGSSWVRGNVARNPSTPVEVLRKLSRDKDMEVRETAIETLKKRAAEE